MGFAVYGLINLYIEMSIENGPRLRMDDMTQGVGFLLVFEWLFYMPIFIFIFGAAKLAPKRP